MQQALVNSIAEQLHKEYRATAKHMVGGSAHDHGWKGCHSKDYFLNRAKHMLPLLAVNCLILDPPIMERCISTVMTAAHPQLLQARKLLAAAIRAYCELGRLQQKAKQDLLAAKEMLEAATAAGISFDYNPETGKMDARNKLAAKRPTCVIKLPNAVFSTMKITKIEGKAVAPIILTPESVPDATGDSSTEKLLGYPVVVSADLPTFEVRFGPAAPICDEKLPWTNKTRSQVAAEWDVLL